jgi:hypothetical protein
MYSKLVTVYFLISICCAQKVGKKIEVENKQSGWTIAEAEALEKFRPLAAPHLVRDEDRTDGFLIRWLRANDLDVLKAEQHLKNAQQWRKENQIDTILNETIVDWKPEPFDITGFDREGHPILVPNIGAIDVRKQVVRGNGKLFSRYGIQAIERALARREVASKMFGKNVTQILIIADYSGFSLRQHACLSCIPYIQDLAIKIEKYYPEVAKEFIVINLPRIAIPIFDVAKSLAPRTGKIIKFFGADRAEWSNYLLSIVSPDQLSQQYGGTKEILSQ